jgi:hypothetical protein
VKQRPTPWDAWGVWVFAITDKAITDKVIADKVITNKVGITVLACCLRGDADAASCRHAATRS